MTYRAIQAALVTFEREIFDYRKNILFFTLRNLMQPMLFILVIGVGLGSLVDMPGNASYLQFLLPGILMMSVVQVTFQHFSFEIWSSKNHEKYLELLTMTAPIKPFEAVAGYLLAGMTIALFAVACFMLPLSLFLPSLKVSLPSVALMAAGLGLLFTAVGIITGVCVVDPHNLSTVSIFVTLPLTYLCGVFFPMDMYPEPVKRIIDLIPLTRAIDGLRGDGFPLCEIAYVWAFAVLAASITVIIFKRKMHI